MNICKFLIFGILTVKEQKDNIAKKIIGSC